MLYCLPVPQFCPEALYSEAFPTHAFFYPTQAFQLHAGFLLQLTDMKVQVDLYTNQSAVLVMYILKTVQQKFHYNNGSGFAQQIIHAANFTIHLLVLLSHVHKEPHLTRTTCHINYRFLIL